MTWKPEWEQDTQILIQNPQLQDIPVWRDFEYYVNANSQSLVEVGTKDHPYKELDSVFVEIMNFHSHSERNIMIYVLEGTSVFANSVTYIVNMTHVQIESYSESSQEAGLARMVGINNISKAISPALPTNFNILGKDRE